ncbi:hypothetical protein [Butyricimonas sp.]|uniref:hypothetical protein n=1 Tax=Butyricimonas sp. TaxID=1969738 RepID=UPI0025C6E768|nr:hypothetical protein [Butyricimonas sp.]
MKFICILYIFIFCISCNPNKERAEIIVKQWLEKEIKFPDTINIKQDSLWKSLTSKEFKILTIVDSNSCTECRLKLHEWGKYIKEIDSINTSIAFIFVVHTKDYAIVETLKKKNKFRLPIFHDYENKMGKLNLFPKDPNYQTFLLNKENKVILIGNPIGNLPLWKLYKKVLSEALSTKKSS